ncbi:MAG: hypothetical protein KGZ80_08080 [Methylomonas sp.]|nr:hypothetical protein [Methylomonas sp.]
MKKFSKTPLTLAMGTAVLSGLAVNVHADSNPFALVELSSGYTVAEASNTKANSHGACGGNVADADGRRIDQGQTKGKPAAKSSEGACGEGMCGAMMSGGKMKKGMEGMCGDMMKGKEGACGMMGGDQDAGKAAEGSCGAMMKNGTCPMMGGMSGMTHGGGQDAAKSQEGSCGAMMKDGGCPMMKGGESQHDDSTDKSAHH